MKQHHISKRELVERIELQARAMRHDAVMRCAAAIVAAVRSSVASIASRGASHDLALRRRS